MRKVSIYRRNDKEADEIAHRTGQRPLTRFGEAMAELGVKLTCAPSPWNQGRVERANATHQDRLVKLLKLEGITDMDAANAYLQRTYLPEHNAKFAVEPDDAADAHRSAPSADTLDATLCPVRERRVVDHVGCVSWRGRCFELLDGDATPRRRRQVLVRQRLDGRVELTSLSNGRVLSSQERSEHPRAVKPVAASLAERIAGHAPPSTPAANHLWRKPITGSGCGPARCARLPCAALRDQNPHKGTLLLRLRQSPL